MDLIKAHIRELHLNEELTAMLINNCWIDTIEDLLNVSFQRLFKNIDKCFSKEKSERYKRELRSKVHNANLYFASEFNGKRYIKIDEDTLIEDLNMPISKETQIALKESGIITIKDLVNTDCQNLNDTLRMGKARPDIYIITERLHEYGFHMKNEISSTQEKKLLRERGEILLEEVGFRGHLLGLVNKYNIYTLRHLLDAGIRIYDLPGIGPKFADDIDYFLAAMDLRIRDPYPETSLDQIKSQISDYRISITKIKELIEEKERLIEEYESLVKKGDELKAIGDDLDEKILRLAEEIKRRRM